MELQFLEMMQQMMNQLFDCTHVEMEISRLLFEAYQFFTNNMFNVNQVISGLSTQINASGNQNVNDVFNLLYLVIGMCVMLCLIVSMLVIPLQQYYVRREYDLLTLCRTFSRIDIMHQLQNARIFLRKFPKTENLRGKITQFQSVQKDKINTRSKVNKQFRDTYPTW